MIAFESSRLIATSLSSMSQNNLFGVTLPIMLSLLELPLSSNEKLIFQAQNENKKPSNNEVSLLALVVTTIPYQRSSYVFEQIEGFSISSELLETYENHI